MKQLNNEESIYIFKEIKEKEKPKEIIIENSVLNKNNFLGKLNKKYSVNLSSLNGQYLSNKLFSDNSFILIGLSSVNLYANIIENIKDVVSSKISFNYEKQYKIKSYQINKSKYLIINGKTIILIEKNGRLLISKTYNRLNNIQIVSVIKSEEEKDKFSGYLINIQCLVSYENNHNNDISGNINIQNLVLPQFENDIIIDFRLIYFNLNENRLYKVYKQKLIIFSNGKEILFYLINKENKKVNKLKDFQNNNIDALKVIDDYLFIFYENININIYKIKINVNDEVEINFIKTINYNKSNRIILKRKIFYNKKENMSYLYYIDYSLEQFFFYFNFLSKENDYIIEEKMNQNNKYYLPNNYTKIRINKTYVYIINNKHSVIFDASFYNKLIINYKIFNQKINEDKNIINYSKVELNKAYILLLTNHSEIEIYNFDINNQKINKLLYVISLEFNYNAIIDYIMINEYIILLLNVNTENNILELNKINLNKDENNAKNKNECLLECKLAYNNLYYWKELNLLFINSNYGEISVYNIDSKANIEYINTFNYGYSSSEIIKLKNTLNEDDFPKLFIYDLLSNRLKTFNLTDIYKVDKYKENELYYFHLIIFLYKECFLLFIIMENKYTLINKVLFGKQIKLEKNIINSIKEPFNFIMENLTYDIDNHSFEFIIPHNINK